MATKAQRFRSEQQRAANPPKPKRPKRARRDTVVDTAKPGVSETDRKRARGSNRNRLAGRRGGAALEDAPTPKRSRKSTRKSADRTKRTTNQQLQAVRKSRSPSARAARGKAARTKAAASRRGR